MALTLADTADEEVAPATLNRSRHNLCTTTPGSTYHPEPGNSLESNNSDKQPWLDDSGNDELSPAAPVPAWLHTTLGAANNPEPGDGNNLTLLPALHIGPAGTTRILLNVDPREELNANNDGLRSTPAERPSGYCHNPQGQEQP